MKENPNNTNASTNFWIKLLPEHIDQNLDSFLSFLSTRRRNADGDPAFAESVSLLEERCAQIHSMVTATCPGQPDGALLGLAVRLYGARTLFLRDSDPEKARTSFVQMLAFLAALLPAQAAAILPVMTRAVTCKHITSTGFGWKNVTGGDSAEIVAAVILSGAEFSQETLPDRWYEGEGLGAVHVCDGRVEAWPISRDAVRKLGASSTAFREPFTGARVMSDTLSKVRTADKRDFDRINVFLRDFCNEAQTLRRSPEPAPLQYEDGDTFPVRYISVDRFDNMVLESADAEHEKVRGIIRNDMPPVKTYTAGDLTDLMEKGDVFLAKWNRKASRFILSDTVGDYMKRIVPVGATVTALCKGDNGYGRLLWLTDKGFPVTTRPLASYSQGDYALMSVNGMDDKGNVRVHVMRHTDQGFFEDDARQDFLKGFSQSTPDFPEVPRREDVLSDGTQLAFLARTLLLAATREPDTMDRRETIVTALLLSHCAGDAVAERCCRLCLGHLRNLVAFMEGRPEMISPEPYGTADMPAGGMNEKMYLTAGLLKFHGLAGAPEAEKETFIKEWGGLPDSDDIDAGTKDLAALLSAERKVRGIVPDAALASIRRKVLELLNVSREEYEGMDVFGYLGPESGMQEYKTSFLIAPKDAAEQNQERTIFRVVDAFLNSKTGGTLYIGVNDGGYVSGVEEDIRLLERLNKSKKGMDGLLRTIRMRLETAFPQEVYMTLSIYSVFEDRAVRIDVPPYVGGVVRLDGVAWVRFGSECVRMRDSLIETVENERKARKEKD